MYCGFTIHDTEKKKKEKKKKRKAKIKYGEVVHDMSIIYMSNAI